MAGPAPSEYVPPPDPDFYELGKAGWNAWLRDKPSIMAFDTETSGLSFHDAPFCVTVAWERPRWQMKTIGTGPGPKNVLVQSDSSSEVVTYAQWKNKWSKESVIEAHYFELSQPNCADAVARMLRDTPVLVGHNVKFDLQKCIYAGLIQRSALTADRIEDTEALAHLDNEHRLKALKSLAVEVLHEEDVVEVEIQSGPRKGEFRTVPREKHELDAVRRKLKVKKDDGFQVIPRAILLPYAVKDAELTLRLYEALRSNVSRYDDLERLYQQEKRLTLVFLDMEAQGMGVDEAYLSAQTKQYTKQVLATERRIAQVTGKRVQSAILPPTPGLDGAGVFNPNSNPQIAEFFSDAGFEHPKYDKAVLSTIKHPLAAELLALRGDLKILNNYFRGIEKETVDGVFHPWFRQYGTVTGRSSSGSAQAD